MMKKLALIILIVPLYGQAQYFRGEIIYETKIFPKSDTIDLERIMNLNYGSTASYIINAKRYKSTHFKDGKYYYSYTYDDETRRMFDDYEDRKYITFRDSRKPDKEYYGSTIQKDSTISILGYKCYLVTTKTDYGTTSVFYPEDIKVDYSNFEDHQVGNWYEILKEVDGAISLKTITEYDNYTKIEEAVKINKRRVKKKEFRLPDKPIVAEFSALDQRAEMKQPTQEQIQCYQQKVWAVSKLGGNKYVSYVRFLLSKDGETKFIEPVEEGDSRLYKVAVDVIENCGLQFKPGLIKGEPVDSQVFFPVEFLK